MDSFETFWEYLLKNLKAGTIIQNWTADKGYLDDSMVIRSIADRAINIEAPNAKHVQSVSREHFESVFDVWELYKTKVIKRPVIRDMTRFSKYIISIMKWWEGTRSD